MLVQEQIMTMVPPSRRSNVYTSITRVARILIVCRRVTSVVGYLPDELHRFRFERGYYIISMYAR